MFNLIHGDCLEVMAELPDNSVDAVVTDPPYGLSFMSKDWDQSVPGPEYWTEALRVAKPGSMLLAFGGTRVFHRLMVAIEDSGWQIRDTIMWVYGSGFPKSANISKLIDKELGCENVVGSIPDRWTGKGNTLNLSTDRPQSECKITIPASPQAQQWDGYGTALKPAWEPIIVAMKPIDGTYANNAMVHGVAGMNIDDCRVPITDGAKMARANTPGSNGWKNSSGGKNSAALNGEPSGRWPANLIHDGSDEVKDLFPYSESGGRVRKSDRKAKSSYGFTPSVGVGPADTKGSAARFFYCAKASKSDRNSGLTVGESNSHPTVKPTKLMRYLCKLVGMPNGSVILDPFMGSGSTGIAAVLEGQSFVGIDLDAEHVATAQQRIEAASLGYEQLELV